MKMKIITKDNSEMKMTIMSIDNSETNNNNNNNNNIIITRPSLKSSILNSKLHNHHNRHYNHHHKHHQGATKKRCKGPKREEFEVDSIIDRKFIDSKLYYCIKWTGYGDQEISWQPVENLENCLQMVEEYEDERSMILFDYPDETDDEQQVSKVVAIFRRRDRALLYWNNDTLSTMNLYRAEQQFPILYNDYLTQKQARRIK